MEGISVILKQLSPGLAAGLLAATALIGYLLGNCNGAVMVSRLLFHDDVRTHGSGNGGLTNFHRTYGGKWVTIVVIAVDMLKVVAAVYLSLYIFRRYMPYGYVPLFVKYWAGIWTVVGHVFPFALKFHGGKGILAGGTLALLVDWRVAVCAWGCFFIGVLLTRWVSMGSLLAATAFGVSSALFHPTPSIAIPALLAGALIDWKHKENFKRIRAGTESKLTFKKKDPPQPSPGAVPAAVPAQKTETAPVKQSPAQTKEETVPPAPAQPVSKTAPIQPKPEGITQKIIQIPIPVSAGPQEKPQTEGTAVSPENQGKGEAGNESRTNYLEQIDAWIQADHPQASEDKPEEPVPAEATPEPGEQEASAEETEPDPEASDKQTEEEQQEVETP